jgi:hypothetical protein
MKKIILLFITGLFAICTMANNVRITNLSLVNNGPNNIYVQFDLAWDNSWRILSGQANYDGVWVFFKYRFSGGAWTHLLLNTNTSADLLPAGFDYFRPAVAIGAAIHRSASNTGTGNVTATGVRLSVINSVPYDIELKAYGIEMVYIPAPPADFRVGDGDGTNESTNAFHPGGTDNQDTRNNFISNVDVNGFDDAEIETGNDFVFNGGGADGINGLTINNNFFPTSSAIWCMKYEITQGAYRDFLNSLTLAQQTTRTGNAPTSAIGTGALTTAGTNRNYLEISTSSTSGIPAVYGCDGNNNNVYDETDDGEFLACNFLNWPDIAAWLDWAGLCPMTEIHFERICRGTTSAGSIASVFGEFAWGSTAIANLIYILTGAGAENELASNASTTAGNANYVTSFPNAPFSGPLRNGIFATATSTRAISGSSFYGVMEMSGNVIEACVTLGNIAGRSYNRGGPGASNGAFGNGTISATGNADARYWPGNVANATTETVAIGEVTTSFGTMRRGGSWAGAATELRTSDRSGGQIPAARTAQQGGRGILVPAMY